MRFDVVTLFPEMLGAVTEFGVTRRAIEQGLMSLHGWNPRDFAVGKYRAVDDRPYGGGPGMIMMARPLAATLEAVRGAVGKGPPVLYMSPQGQVLNQGIVSELAGSEHLILLSGRYEGVDERVLDAYVDQEYSIGDYVISGGELAAMVLIDAVARQLPGVLGNEESAVQDSFVAGLLDCPHYTRPEVFEGARVPEVLASGDHQAIRRWRAKQALGRTWLRRPDLLRAARLSEEQQGLLEEFRIEYEQEYEHDESDTGT